MKNISDKSCRENRNTHFVFNESPPPKIMPFMRCEKKKKYATPQQATDGSYQFTKATDTHSEYVIPTAFPQQQWLRERKLILGFTYIAWLAIRASNGMTSKPFSAA